MIITAPMPSKANIRIGTHGGLTFTALGIGGVYRPDELSSRACGGAGLLPD